MTERCKPLIALLVLLPLMGCPKQAKRPDYSRYVWPPPPDEARIQLEAILRGRVDVEGLSGIEEALIGSNPGPYDWLRKPFDVAFDGQGRLLVTDPGLGAVIRFDRERSSMDVLGTQGPVRVRTPLGLSIGPDGTTYVADVGLHKVVAFDAEWRVKAVYGREGELSNPTDAVLSPDGARLFVADSKAHKILVFDVESGRLLTSLGTRGEGEGEFSFPTSLVFDGEGDLFVVDQLNARVQVLTEDGRFLDQFGALGVGFGNFVRPKDVAVDEQGLIYVSDAAFNNIQLFDTDFTLLTFVGEGGKGPGQFNIVSGLDVSAGRFAAVDQLNGRVQLFRFITPAGQDR